MFGTHHGSKVAAATRDGLRAALAWMPLAIACLVLSGCGYSFRAPYDKSVRTVYVPMFKSQTFRRDLEKMLTEKVIKEITRRTPYQIAGSLEEADTVLHGTVNFADKNLILENGLSNLPRQMTATINISVNWTHNPPTESEKNRPPTAVTQTVNFIPEAGETVLTAYDKVAQSLAAQIVDMMEQPWYFEEDMK